MTVFVKINSFVTVVWSKTCYSAVLHRKSMNQIFYPEWSIIADTIWNVHATYFNGVEIVTWFVTNLNCVFFISDYWVGR